MSLRNLGRILNDKYFLFYVIPALLLPTLGSLIYFSPIFSAEFSKAAYFISKLLLVLWPIYFVLRSKNKIKLDWTNKTSIKLGTIFAVLSGVLILAILPIAQNFQPSIQAVLEKFQLLNPLHLIIFGIIFSLFHSTVEEYYWRWYLLSELTVKFSPRTAILISSLAFTSHHLVALVASLGIFYGILISLPVLLAGFFWANLFWRTKSVTGNFISHLVCDLAIIAVGYLTVFKANLDFIT
jgi:membrane protease YdiL (CAAX protease family)